jgi:aspartate/methionine/tyrosine aminotransferase
MSLNPQAISLNQTIEEASPAVYNLLSRRGRAIFFPKLGILSQTAEAKGKSINATIGTALEDNGKAMVLESLDTLINLEKTAGFSYAPSSGRPEIRSAWRKMMIEKNPSLKGKKFGIPVVSSALTHGLSMTGYLFVDEHDEIITPDRYWENYDLIFGNAYGGKQSTFPTFVDNTHFNCAGLREKLLEVPTGKKIIILNFPNNPTGYTVTKDEAMELRDLLVEAADAGSSVAVIIDDAYFGLVYEEHILGESMFSLLADAHENILAVKLDGPTKEDYVWGFRVGFITFGIRNGSDDLYRALEAKLSGAIRGNISNASNIGQSLLLDAYTSVSYQSEKKEKYDTLEHRYRKIKELLSQHPEYAEHFHPLPFNSGYFMCIRVVSGDAETLRKCLLDKYSTGLIAQGDVLRIAFSSIPYEMIDRLFDNCYRAAQECG